MLSYHPFFAIETPTMYELFADRLQGAKDLEAPERRFNSITAIIRSMLQHAAIGAFEKFDQVDQLDPREATTVLHLLRRPLDSSPLDVLNRLIPYIRASHAPQFCNGWFETPSSDRSTESTPLCTWLAKWVTQRNTFSHTIADQHAISQILPEHLTYAHHILAVLIDVLPVSSDSNTLTHNFLDLTFPSKTLKLHDGVPVVIRHISSRRGIWHVHYRSLDIDRSVEGRYAIPDAPILKPAENSTKSFATSRIPLAAKSPGDAPVWTTDTLVPNRQTYLFQGRELQLEELYDWYNDESSRMCLVYGDGGIGKTSLVLEFLHNVLDCPREDVTWFPSIICFYTAKLTRWTPDGLEHLSVAGPPMLADALRRLVSVIENPGRDWYGLDERQIVDKLAGVWNGVGIAASDVLLVVDNAETLARRPADEPELHRFLTMISRKVARVIVTSRRYEKIEARPVEVPSLNLADAIALLKRLAEEDEVEPILRAKDKALTQLSNGLGCKPLLIEAVSKFLQQPGVTIAEARNMVQDAVMRDLGDFLYDDAWRRIHSAHRNVFMTLASLRDLTITNEIVGWTCREFDTPHLTWLDAFSETNLGTLAEYGVGYEIVFLPEAIAFFRLKKQQAAKDDAERIETAASVVVAHYEQLQEGDAAYTSDRIAAAFKNSAAKAAKLCVHRGDYDEAEMWFNEAVIHDPNNSALFDRFAYFQMHHQRNFSAAREKARRAVFLDATNEEALFTAGMVEYRDQNVDGGDQYMTRAKRSGKPIHLCLIQKARGRLFAADDQGSSRDRIAMLQEAQDLFLDAQVRCPNDRYYRRNVDQCRKGVKLADRGLPTREKLSRRKDQVTVYIGRRPPKSSTVRS